eukprot:CAMPEP_0206217766 /NCGR_PEP_ID=MMETSP0047_2-20121206/3444_1 /ASSEMBLY_ACC=CAM_ASM_000192 /TAXON_ID=195065 /ORGANISM="Chroomonas mesostigmatica_cf, Strain CCMP1168" /LENGTH=131 /DNA_ID=CAMNT_0053640231 /DNA_START=814 /DNA_END=1206 /DNA_ORIENTATION=-
MHREEGLERHARRALGVHQQRVDVRLQLALALGDELRGHLAEGLLAGERGGVAEKRAKVMVELLELVVPPADDPDSESCLDVHHVDCVGCCLGSVRLGLGYDDAYARLAVVDVQLGSVLGPAPLLQELIAG